MKSFFKFLFIIIIKGIIILSKSLSEPRENEFSMCLWTKPPCGVLLKINSKVADTTLTRSHTPSLSSNLKTHYTNKLHSLIKLKNILDFAYVPCLYTKRFHSFIHVRILKWKKCLFL